MGGTADAREGSGGGIGTKMELCQRTAPQEMSVLGEPVQKTPFLVCDVRMGELVGCWREVTDLVKNEWVVWCMVVFPSTGLRIFEFDI